MLSIIMPVYNQWNFTRNILNAFYIFDPWYDWELIIISDGSTDETNFFLKQINHKNIRVVIQDNIGVNATWNKGILLAQYEYVCVINNDIEFLDDTFTQLINWFWDNSVYITTALELRWTFKKREWELIWPHHYSKKYSIWWACWMIKKSQWGLLWPIPETMKIFCWDNYLYWKAKKCGGIVNWCAVVHHYTSQTVLSLPLLSSIDIDDKIEYKNICKLEWFNDPLVANIIDDKPV